MNLGEFVEEVEVVPVTTVPDAVPVPAPEEEPVPA